MWESEGWKDVKIVRGLYSEALFIPENPINSKNVIPCNCRVKQRSKMMNMVQRLSHKTEDVPTIVYNGSSYERVKDA